jgi:hypothetical protein
VVVSRVRQAARGPALDDWHPPPWLLPHQAHAASRVAGSLRAFGGALLADAVGLGKTYVALAVATRYATTTVVAPASLLPQWRRAAGERGIALRAVSLESLSRRATVPPSELLVADEAHRFRNAETIRYDRLARGVRGAHVLLVTATPVVNHAVDLVHLLRLFLADGALALLGVASLEEAADSGNCARLLYTAAPLVVARPAAAVPGLAARLPNAIDHRLLRAPPLPEATLGRLIPLIDGLAFPGFADRDAAELLRRHLFHRLASSAAALTQTVARHRRYVDHALHAAAHGERLQRRDAARMLAGDGDLQLELGGQWSDGGRTAVDPRALEAERERLARLADAIPGRELPAPKAEILAQLLERRTRRKTIVFTTAVATALDLARRLRWRRVAVVGGGRAWIASGPLPLEQALSLFAPRARGARPPASSQHVTVLLATDLVSEGLDLQDADAVVHYDLPWTPLRLAQRLGRIARLGSHHATVDVWWFAPPAALAKRLGLEDRLEEKATRQLLLPVPGTSRVGRGLVASAQLMARERLGTTADCDDRQPSGFAVLRGAHVSAFAVSWLVRGQRIPELVALESPEGEPVRDYCRVEQLVRSLADAREETAEPPPLWLHALRRLIRERLALADRGCCSRESVRLRRRVLARARIAARRRRLAELDALDVALDRLAVGLSVGAERDLADALERRGAAAIREWLDRWARPCAPVVAPECRVEAALFGTP